VIHHTNSGMTFFTDELMRGLLANSLAAALGAAGFHDVGNGPGSTDGEYIDWPTIRNQPQSVAADVRRIRKHRSVLSVIPI
jgi:carbonic anhydrase